MGLVLFLFWANQFLKDILNNGKKFECRLIIGGYQKNILKFLGCDHGTKVMEESANIWGLMYTRELGNAIWDLL